MPTRDIIDNRAEKLVDHINRILSSTEAARFAVGYFFLSGLESIAQRLAGVKELRLLIGNTTNRETLEQLAEGYRRLELVAEAAEAEAYPKRTETKRMTGETATNILIRRTRNHILRWYGFDSQTHQPIDPSLFKEYLDGKKRAYVMVGGRHQFFPKRELETIEYNAAVMRVLRQFAEEVKHRQAERLHTLSLSNGQTYVLREMRVLFGATEEDDQKAMINVVEKAFRGPVSRAVNRELNLLRRNGVSGQPLLKNLARIYDQHNLREWIDRRTLRPEEHPVPKVVCSEALM
ncbi:MAG: hypothetical protein HY360_13415 [Verrucomicrobia bacterium]|nr:hypothetical protein [Verrucomicrobiota bacterium]